MQLLEPEFRAHLEGMEPDAIAGEASNRRACPIAVYLIARNQSNPRVDIDGYATTEMGAFRSPPPWAQVFIRKVDGPNCYEHAITAGDALSILDSIDEGSAS